MAEPLAYSIYGAAEVLGVSEWLVRKLVRRGDIPAIRVGDRRVLIPHAGLVQWLNGQGPSAARPGVAS